MKFKAIVFIIMFSAMSFLEIASQEALLEDMQGLSLKGEMIFELKGYQITVNREKAAFSKKKDIEKMKKKYGMENAHHMYKDPQIKWQHTVMEADDELKGVPKAKVLKKCYFIPESDKWMMVVLMQSVTKRDTLIEKSFMDAFFSRSLSQYTTENWTADSINFVGRQILLGDMCNWVSPQNVHCAAFGQMSWSVFDDEQQALTNTRILEARNLNEGKYKVENEEDVNVLFEGITTVAKRVTYKIKIPKILLGGRNLIAVYYITQKIRGKYVSCVLSNYIEEKGNYDLPYLLQEVMRFAD